MAVENKTQTQEEINQGNTRGDDSRNNLLDKIKGSDVFKEFKIPEEPQEEVKPEIEQPTEEVEETEEVSETEEVTETEELEDLVPKSKIQPRFDKLNAKIKYLESELENQKVNKATETKPVDDTTAKLQTMSHEELKVLKRQVRVAELEAHANKDQKKLDDLLDLQDKIDETVASAPARFNQAQINAYNRMADKIAMDDSIKNVEEAAPQIINMAKEIYQKYPKLQLDVDGQATALEMAADKYKELSKYSLTKKSVNNLKSQVNTLKRKTNLDTGTNKTTGDANILDKLRSNASGGTSRDKHMLVREDPRFKVNEMIPSEYS
jgi:hypothetical protein